MPRFYDHLSSAFLDQKARPTDRPTDNRMPHVRVTPHNISSGWLARCTQPRSQQISTHLRFADLLSGASWYPCSARLCLFLSTMLSLDAGNSQWQRIEVTGIILAAETSLSPRSSRGRMVAVRKDGRVDADGWCGAIALSAALPPPTQTRLTNQPIAIKKFRPNRN